MSLLIDADYITYRSCVSNEIEIDWGNDVTMITSRTTDAVKSVEYELFKIQDSIGKFDGHIILFYSSTSNFRKLVDPEYKGHRNRRKPCGYRKVINILSERYETLTIDNLEADDALGIYATREPGHIVVSPDKDLRQIPGTLYDMTNPVQTITPEDGFAWFLTQTMSGDATDGYPGIPGIGLKRADALLTKNGYTWDTVLNAFKDAGLSEDDALRNARLAKILTNDDFDPSLQKPRLWTPASGGGADNRTELQAAAD